jgi:hypothetical protein
MLKSRVKIKPLIDYFRNLNNSKDEKIAKIIKNSRFGISNHMGNMRWKKTAIELYKRLKFAESEKHFPFKRITLIKERKKWDKVISLVKVIEYDQNTYYNRIKEKEYLALYCDRDQLEIFGLKEEDLANNLFNNIVDSPKIFIMEEKEHKNSSSFKVAQFYLKKNYNHKWTIGNDYPNRTFESLKEAEKYLKKQEEILEAESKTVDYFRVIYDTNIECNLYFSKEDKDNKEGYSIGKKEQSNVYSDDIEFVYKKDKLIDPDYFEEFLKQENTFEILTELEIHQRALEEKEHIESKTKSIFKKEDEK